MKKPLTVMALVTLAFAAGSVYSQQPGLDAYLEAAEISEMDWRLHLVDEQLLEALREGGINYHSRARYTLDKKIHMDFVVPARDLDGFPEAERQNRLLRVVNLSGTLLVNSLPEFRRDRDLSVAFVSSGNPDRVYAAYRDGELTFLAN